MFAPMTIRCRTPSSTVRSSASRTVCAPEPVATDDDSLLADISRCGVPLQLEEGDALSVRLAVTEVDAKLPGTGAGGRVSSSIAYWLMIGRK